MREICVCTKHTDARRAYVRMFFHAREKTIGWGPTTRADTIRRQCDPGVATPSTTPHYQVHHFIDIFFRYHTLSEFSDSDFGGKFFSPKLNFFQRCAENSDCNVAFGRAALCENAETLASVRGSPGTCQSRQSRRWALYFVLSSVEYQVYHNHGWDPWGVSQDATIAMNQTKKEHEMRSQVAAAHHTPSNRKRLLVASL